jgi:hypothetical protein
MSLIPECSNLKLQKLDGFYEVLVIFWPTLFDKGRNSLQVAAVCSLYSGTMNKIKTIWWGVGKLILLNA